MQISKFDLRKTANGKSPGKMRVHKQCIIVEAFLDFKAVS